MKRLDVLEGDSVTNNKKTEALSQVLLLILGIFAFGFILGSEIGVVSAGPDCEEDGSVYCEGGLVFQCRYGSPVPIDEADDCSTYTPSTDIYNLQIMRYLNNPSGYSSGVNPPPLNLPSETQPIPEEEPKKDLLDTSLSVVSTVSLAKNILKTAPSKIISPALSGVESMTSTIAKISAQQSANALNTINAANLVQAKSVAYRAAYNAGIKKGVGETAAHALGEKAAAKVGAEKGLGIFLKNLKTALTKNIWSANAGTNSVTLSGGVAAGIYASAGAYAAKMIFKYAGAGERNMETISKVTTAVAVTGMAFFTIWGAVGESFLGLGAIPGVGWIFLGAMAVTALVSAILYKNMSHEIFSYKLTLWQPALGGETCQDCNDLEYGCSEYQCKTYGAACDIINVGTKDELCDWKNIDDMDPPIMNTLDVLGPGYRYNPDTGVQLPDTGFNLEYSGNNDGCLPSFEGIEFGITTDEPAQCKIDMDNAYKYEDMLGFMAEGSVFIENHTFSIPNIALPSAYAINEAGFTIDEGNNYEFYMRCMDVNGNDSPYSLGIKFCVDNGPDTTAPTISTNYVSGAYIKSNQTEITDLEVYTNEPADCRWDFNNVEYDNMANNMTDCSTNYGVYTFPASYSYGCRATLKGVKEDKLNTYYIRCEDKPGLSVNNTKETRIQNRDSYVLELEGTKGIVIDEILINQKNKIYTADGGIRDGVKVSDSTDTIQVRVDISTTQGAGKKGEARCSYSESGLRYEFTNNQNYDYTNLNNHYWYLRDGKHDYEIECCDLANNCDAVDISFDVEADTNPPLITRSYYEDDLMKIVTSEDSTCVYSLSTCNYDIKEGLRINTDNFIDHFITWDEKESYYVKCNDAYENYPDEDECSIIVRAQHEYEDATILE